MYKAILLGACILAVLTGCATSDSSLRDSGKSEAYILGFHDGRHSGMKEAGNYLEHMVKDQQRFDTDPDYKSGWLDGEAECKRMQQQADAAVGNAGAYQIGKDVEKSQHDMAKDAVKGVDTSGLEVLRK